MVFRGYVYRNLADHWPAWACVLGQAVLCTGWGLLIGAARSPDRLVLFLTFAIALGMFRALTGNLWTSVGFHLGCQVTTQLVGGSWITPPAGETLRIDDEALLQIVAFWLVPTVLTPPAIAAVAVVRRARERVP